MASHAPGNFCCSGGTKFFLGTLFFWAIALPIRAQEDDYTICDHKFCQCLPADHPQWIRVSCQMDFQTDLTFPPDLSLEHVTDIEVSAAYQVTFEKHAFFFARNLRRITMRNCTTINFKPHAIVEIQTANLRVEIVKSDYVVFHKMSFATGKRMLQHPSYPNHEYVGPNMIYAGVSLHLEHCREVLMAGQVFSNIQDLNMSNIQNLRLAEGALQLDPKAIVSHHGPELIIELSEVTLKEIPKDTFATSAARITLRSVHADIVQKGAFSAITINHLFIQNCNFDLVKSDAFKDGILIENFEIRQSKIDAIEPNAIVAGITSFVVDSSSFTTIQPRAIDVSAATVEFLKNEVKICANNSIKINNFSNFTVAHNRFMHFQPFAIELHPAVNQSPSTFVLADNQMNSFPQVNNASVNIVAYGNNYGLCHCDMSSTWMTLDHYRNNMCHGHNLRCNQTDSKSPAIVKIERVTIEQFLETCVHGFVHKNCSNYVDAVTRHKTDKPIATKFNTFTVFIVPPLATFSAIFICLVIYFWTIGRMKYRVCCNRVKGTCRGLFLLPLCFNRSNCDIEATGSISQLPIPQDYTEMQYLNTPYHEFTTIPAACTEVYTADKATQSLPEELTQEFLESLKERLDDPEKYEEAKAIVDHLYELVKAEETCNVENRDDEENIYDLPLPPPEKRIKGKKKPCVSVGTDAPSLEQLLPFSPYDRHTSLCHEYFEPKDLAVHIYAEISNYARSAKGSILKSTVPDVLVGQAMPRGPFLRAVQQKKVEPTATMRSNSSVSSNVSAKMINRPLPAQPNTFDAGEGTSAHVLKA